MSQDDVPMSRDDILDAAIAIGSRLLESGAEISRVEESMQRMIQAYGILDCDVFAIPTCIIVSIPSEGLAPQTRLKRIYERQTNLGKVSRLNDLCRRIGATLPSADWIRTTLAEIDSHRNYSFKIQLFGYALISASFARLFGGSWADAAFAVPCGASLKFLVEAMSRFRTNRFFINGVGSALVTTLAYSSVWLGLPIQIDKVIIGTLMNLVPGVAITTSMQDIIAGDLVAGQAKLAEALMTATAIALGTGSALALLRLA
jgi:uncharacterized membrane protein YjjP (DUF1212 family)